MLLRKEYQAAQTHDSLWSCWNQTDTKNKPTVYDGDLVLLQLCNMLLRKEYQAAPTGDSLWSDLGWGAEVEMKMA